MDLTQWPTLEEAAAALHTSPRTLRREQDRGKLEIRKRDRPHKKPENVVNPADLEKLIAAQAPRPFPVQIPATAPPAPLVPSSEPIRQAVNQDAINRFISELAEAIARTSPPALPPPPAEPASQAPAVPLHIKLNLTLEEAAAYSGYSTRNLRRAIENGCFDARRDGPHRSWIIKRSSLEEWCKR